MTKQPRCVRLAAYMLDKQTTIRKTASHFHMAKTTVHKYITADLKAENIALYRKIRKLLDYNNMQKHHRGGQTTKLKYEKLRKKSLSQTRQG